MATITCQITPSIRFFFISFLSEEVILVQVRTSSIISSITMDKALPSPTLAHVTYKSIGNLNR